MSLHTPTPRNLRIKGGGRTTFVESDVSGVCAAIKRMSEDLYVVLQEGAPKPWVVMELCRDGECRLVARYEELDHRIIGHLHEMLNTPFQVRIDKMQKELDHENDFAARARESEAWDHFVWDFNRELGRCNFVDPKYFRSFRPKVKTNG